MSGFTPGPWTFSLPADGKFGIYNEEGYRVASVHDFNRKPENHANSRLIAAAPRLYEALQKIAAEDHPDGFFGRIAKKALEGLE